MPQAVGNSYSVPSGRTINAGRAAAVPSWLSAQAVGSAAFIPGNNLAAVNPELTLGSNPAAPGSAVYHGISGHPGIENAWGSATYSRDLHKFFKALQGGHGDWAGNENYSADFSANTVNWAMLKGPTVLASFAAYGVITNTEFYNGTTELRAVHPYNNNLYVPGVGVVITRFAGTYPGGEGDVNKSYLMDATTGAISLFSNWGLSSTGTPYGGAAFDESRNMIWTTGVGNTPLVGIHTVTKVASILVSSNNFIDAYAKLVSVPEYDLMAFFHGGGGGYPKKFYLRERGTPYTKYEPTITGTVSAGLNFNGQVGADWDAVGNCFYLWNNTTNTNEVTVLTAPANPRTDPWVASVRTFTGVTVPAANSNGTYGRVAFDPIYKALLISAPTTTTQSCSLRVR